MKKLSITLCALFASFGANAETFKVTTENYAPYIIAGGGKVSGVFGFELKLALNSCYVRGLKPFRTLCYFKSYSIAFCKGFEAFACDCGEMAKYILATFLLKKSKTLAVIKPFNCSVYHVLTSPDSS